MFSRILIPLDGTPEANAALPVARTLASATGATITLLRVVRQPFMLGQRIRLDDVDGALNRLANENASATIRVQAVVREGDIVQEILQQSRDQAADLIIMRTHGRAGLGRAVLGSVTEQVLSRSGIPVLLVRPETRRVERIRKLLVPVDGSPGGVAALETAAELAKLTGAGIRLLEVAVPVPMTVYAGYVYGGMAAFDPSWDEESFASARTYVHDVTKRLHDMGIVADGEARQQPNVAEAIVAAAENAGADLIVMSTQALTGPARAVLGSVADVVVRQAHCPVLLVHRSDAVHTV